jgi:hypothetical protein
LYRSERLAKNLGVKSEQSGSRDQQDTCAVSPRG